MNLFKLFENFHPFVMVMKLAYYTLNKFRFLLVHNKIIINTI